jgi:hypothetical protein
MKKWIMLLVFSFYAMSYQLCSEESTKGRTMPDGLCFDFSVGYSALDFNDGYLNGFNFGVPILQRNKESGVYYGIDWSLILSPDERDLFAMLTVGPTTGVRLVSKGGFTFEIGVSSGVSLLKLYNQYDYSKDVHCFTGKTKLGMGYKAVLIQLESGYYSGNGFDFTGYSLNLKYIID